MDELLKLAKKEKLDELESAWMELIEEESLDLDSVLQAPQVLAQRGHKERAESLLWFLADALKESGRHEEAFRAARAGAMIVPDSELLRGLLLELYRPYCEHRADAEDLLQSTLGAEGMALDQGVRSLEQLVQLAPGAYVFDSRQNKAGKVLKFDVQQGGLVVQFQDEQRTYSSAFATRLEALSEEDFRALTVFERARLETLAKENPEELVQLLLSSVDKRMPMSRLRLYLEPVVGSWKRWWSRVKGTLGRSAIIGMTAGDSPSLFLRREPLTHEERLLKRFRTLSGPAEKLSMALHILREAPDLSGSAAELAETVGQELAALQQEALASADVVAVAVAAVIDAFARRFPDLKLAEAHLPDKLNSADGAAMAERIEGPEVLICVAEFLARERPAGWVDFLSAMMLGAPRRVCEAAARALAEHGETEALRRACRTILQSPDVRLGAVVWLWHESATGKGAIPKDTVEPLSALFKLLNVGGALMRDTTLSAQERKEFVSEVRAAVTARNGQLLERTLRDVPSEKLATAAGMLERSPLLTEGMQARITAMLRQIDSKLFVQEAELWEEDVIYTTEEGLTKRKADLQQLVNVRLPQVFRQIGEAASFGDVSDNAEYQSALRERGRLADLAERIRLQIEGARSISPEMAQVDHVTVGSKVRTRRLDTGEEKTFIFLGPWDANPEEGIYAYNAPLGRAFMGKRVGETVSFATEHEQRRWEVLRIGPASGAEDAEDEG
ncbi:MAG: GreA/GreB family elongation factor [Planctomycetes bacterium]|nr:GreA/GreB family elongation factor [Planctomycetota bacterium]